jgi:DNA polymerase-2
VDVPITFEGCYKWIAFLPSKTHPRIGVLNRYYGVMENGKIKVRGLEVRRRDTPRFVFDAQTEMIKTLATANNTAELCKKIVTKHMSKHPNRYKQHISQVIAAEQLMKEGAEIHAGNNIRFLFTHAEHKCHSRRVKAAQLIEQGVNPDIKKYLLLLYSSAANLLSFSGFTTKSVYDAIRENNQTSITSY